MKASILNFSYLRFSYILVAGESYNYKAKLLNFYTSTVNSLLRPNFCPGETLVYFLIRKSRFTQFRPYPVNTATLLVRPNLHGPLVIELTGLHCSMFSHSKLKSMTGCFSSLEQVAATRYAKLDSSRLLALRYPNLIKNTLANSKQMSRVLLQSDFQASRHFFIFLSDYRETIKKYIC